MDDIFFIQDHINRREKDLAKFVGLNVPLDREENPACPTLMGKFRCRRHESLAVDYFKADVIAKAQILFIRPDFPRIFEDCVHVSKVAEIARARKEVRLKENEDPTSVAGRTISGTPSRPARRPQSCICESNSK